MWKDRTCTGCHQACRYGSMELNKGVMDWNEAYHIRFQESVQASKRGEYGKGVRATRARILGLMHQTKREQWEELVKQCPERIYPPPGEKGLLDFDASAPLEAAEVAAAQAGAMEVPVTRAQLEAQLGQRYARDADEWEAMLAEEYKLEMEHRRRYGVPRPPPQPEPIDEVVAAEPDPDPWGSGGYW